jgi:hypothetical protein
VGICIVVILMGGRTVSAKPSKYLFMPFGVVSSVGRHALARTSVTSRAASGEPSLVVSTGEPAFRPLPGC